MLQTSNAKHGSELRPRPHLVSPITQTKFILELKSMVAYSTQEDPPEIREKLEALQSQNGLIEELQLRLNAARLERDRLEREIDEYRTSIPSGPSYIHRCPKEVLMILFEFYTLENPRVVRRLLQVCREWYQLAISTPRLWNRIPVTPEYVWDMKSSCKDIYRRVGVCLQRSGSLPLELDLNFTNFESSRAKIREKIIDCFWDDIQDIPTLSGWAWNLPTEEIEEFKVIPACHPRHVLVVIRQLTGKTGDVMLRWGSLRLTLPEDPDVAILWKRLSFPTPRLSHMTLIGTYDTTVHNVDASVAFPWCSQAL
ncbi:hypothetical protein M408DRAFT_19959 [Serendipita vermifera MAFF 305830]|uniref:F-box domain-containing protein n=1 Tax=Serendipita vermifera MAFF 305830 TaxID=933852 RepID=A0A0C3BKH2_SERVB|nr:hypothetical protein M408DRAFT_19959 [Serendipita vermifera MAFF 305830]